MARRLDKETGELIEETPYVILAQDAPFFKTPYNHDRDLESAQGALVCRDPSRTQQQFAKDADINNILAKFNETGELNVTGAPIWMDLEDEYDLLDKAVTGWDMEQAWNKLTPEVRNTLRDPRTFVEYWDHCIERGDTTELQRLGLVKPGAPQTPIAPAGTSSTPPSDNPPAAPAAGGNVTP